jgi:hypothetical protein
MDELPEGLDSSAYRWETGRAPAEKGRSLGTYLLGLPVTPASAD